MSSWWQGPECLEKKKLSHFDAFSVCVAQRHFAESYFTKRQLANRAIWTTDILSEVGRLTGHLKHLENNSHLVTLLLVAIALRQMKDGASQIKIGKMTVYQMTVIMGSSCSTAVAFSVLYLISSASLIRSLKEVQHYWFSFKKSLAMQLEAKQA